MSELPEIRFCDPAVVNHLFTLRRQGGITWREMGVAIAICSFLDKKTGSGWVARSTISAISGVDDRHITRVFRKLEAKGFILKTGQPGRPATFAIISSKANKMPLAKLAKSPLAKLAGKQVIKNKQGRGQPPKIPTAFAEWQAARLAAGKVAPVPGKGNFRDARKLEELIPDAKERQAVMAAFFRLPDENGWLAGRGHAFWQLVEHRLDESRQAAADIDRDENPPELVARIKEGIERRRNGGEL